MVQNALEWEPIPDDVLVPRRTRRRDRSVASDVQVFSSTPGKRRRSSSGGGGATTAPAPDHDPAASPPAKRSSPQPAPRDEPVDPPRASAPARPSAPASRPGAVEPIPHSALAALDEGMMRNMKANRKRARDAQTLLKRAVKLGEIKFFNRLVKDFGNDKQLGFAEEAFRRVADAGLERNVYTYTNMLNACVRVGELDRARRTWSDMLAAGVQPNEVTYTVLVKGLAQEGFLEEAANVVEEMRRAGVEPNARTFSTLLRNCVRHADQATADRCFATMREVGTKPDVASFEYLVKTRCAAMDAEGAWAARAEMEREYLDAPPQAHAALATVSSLVGDEKRAREACAAARAAVEANGAGTPEDGGGAGGYGCVGGYGSDSDGGKDGDERTGTRRTPKTAMDGPKTPVPPATRARACSSFFVCETATRCARWRTWRRTWIAGPSLSTRWRRRCDADRRTRRPPCASSRARTTRRGGWISRRCSRTNSRRVSRCAAGTETG